MYRITLAFDPMGRPRKQVPSLCRHKASGQAVIYFEGATIYLGPWGSPESVEKYGKFVAGERPSVLTSYPSMSEIAARYVAHRRSEMPRTSGEPHAIDVALRDAIRVVGDIPVGGLSPQVLLQWRDDMIARGLSITTINKRTNYLLSFVRWSSVMGVVPVEVWQSLHAVQRLKPGRSAAADPRKVEPVDWEHVEKTLPFLSERMRDFVLVQSLTGARAGELVAMTMAQIDAEWVYRPVKHKTASRGHSRAIPISSRAKEIVERRAAGIGPDDPVFGPIRVSSIAHEIAKACEKAGVPRWTSHQLRHRAATIVVSKAGVAAARALLGHKSLAMVSRYARPDVEDAKKGVESLE